jgi:hypothetical protein
MALPEKKKYPKTDEEIGIKISEGSFCWKLEG